MVEFIGRRTELAALGSLLARVGNLSGGNNGLAVLLRGRRRVGKSRLVSEFVARQGLPSLHFSADRFAPPSDGIAKLMAAIAASSLPGAALAEGAAASTLTAALRILAAALPDDRPSVVVLDEIPWLLEAIPGGAGELQNSWDRELSRKPVLLLLLGSDLAMMKELNHPDQPFYGRAREMVLDAMSPSDVAEWTGLEGMDAFDAYLVTGGQPVVAEDWRRGQSMADFLAESFAYSVSALVTEGTRVLDAEFPPATNPRAVLTAVGGRGERTFTGIAQALSGRITPPTLERSLGMLADKQVVTADTPYSTRQAPKDRRWRIADPALRFWLALVEPSLSDIDRGRPDLAMARVSAGYSAWRGRAIEPVVREALWRLLPDDAWPDVREIGGWWPRTNRPEIDLVGGDARPASSIGFVGSIKWRDAPITSRDVDQLAEDALAVPGVRAGVPLVAVCPGGAADPRLAASWTADDLLEAWRAAPSQA